ncbi:alkyl hydroperoxide reductase/ Thiol specific antioxidant/ Mal allergen [Methylobacillus flagellatus KT]|uniref:thioredoxin-dependent peroxiredoxin n=2 Tax=Methylophilaceae TaxID=32011 RepID=Q1GYW2_METFK|nr:alkyl hydroperoxide reductase/ Thiol specific antioxidant/ Mal allergen [Methylobacillus flagellatus KT]
MSTMLNQAIPDFELPSTSGKIFKLSDYIGKKLIIYFYPKDNTPGCTNQGKDLRDLYEAFKASNTDIVGISRDSLKSHENFKAKFSFPFELLSDSEEKACTLFDVIKMKKLYGKEVRGIERSTFVVDEQGVLIREWRKVKVDGHAQQVLEFIQSL